MKYFKTKNKEFLKKSDQLDIEDRLYSRKMMKIKEKKIRRGTSLVVQWLRFRAPNAEGPGSIPGQGTRSHMPQPSLHAATKTQNSQVNKLKKEKKKGERD